jgi:hypothetical protein
MSGMLSVNDINLGNVVAFISIILSFAAVWYSLRDSYHDRVNLNSWETYRAYNEPNVREGRELALTILRTTNYRGLATYEDYANYFNLAAGPDEDSEALRNVRKQRQYLHDLAAFYHETGLLLSRNQLDRDFTLLLIGPGLEDRWNVLRNFGDFYRGTGNKDDRLTYGGLYLLYDAYISWKKRRYGRLKKQMTATRDHLVKSDIRADGAGSRKPRASA